MACHWYAWTSHSLTESEYSAAVIDSDILTAFCHPSNNTCYCFADFSVISNSWCSTALPKRLSVSIIWRYFRCAFSQPFTQVLICVYRVRKNSYFDCEIFRIWRQLIPMTRMIVFFLWLVFSFAETVMVSSVS